VTWTIQYSETFEFFFFFYCVMKNLPHISATDCRDNSFTVDMVKKKLLKMNSKKFKQSKNFRKEGWKFTNLESFLQMDRCLYCTVKHCDGIHPDFLLLQFVAGQSEWLLPARYMQFSQIFSIEKKKYCFLFVNTYGMFCHQTIPGIWQCPKELDAATQLFWDQTYIAKKRNANYLNVGPDGFNLASEGKLSTLAAFTLYKNKFNFEQIKNHCGGLLKLTELKEHYERFQIFDWCHPHHTRILGGLSCKHHLFHVIHPLPHNRTGFINYLKKLGTLLDPELNKWSAPCQLYSTSKFSCFEMCC